MRKKIRLQVCSAMMMGMMAVTSPLYLAEEPETETETETEELIPCGEIEKPADAEIQKDIKEWRWKMINGHLYKRLFNASTGRWETDWILVQ